MRVQKRPEAEKAVGWVFARHDIYSIDANMGSKEGPKWSSGGLGDPEGAQKAPEETMGTLGRLSGCPGGGMRDPWESLGDLGGPKEPPKEPPMIQFLGPEERSENNAERPSRNPPATNRD